MELASSPRKKVKSPGQDGTTNIKTSVTCTNVPEGLFDASAAKKHFSKFGRVQKIRMFPKRHTCIIEYDQQTSVERAVLNAGAYDGFMFDVTRTKPRVRRRSKKEDDPDWVPDSDVEEELTAMGSAPIYRVTRQKPMEVENKESKPKSLTRVIKQSPARVKMPVREKKEKILAAQAQGVEASVVMSATQSSLSTSEAAAELHQLRSKQSLTPDEQWRTLDARDRILRGWGGAGARVKLGGATIGTCPDMCPEKERLHRQAEHQVMTLETVVDSDGQLDPCRAVKQYSRSSADQEIPMCYELRPAPVLMRTCAYLLHEIADTTRQVSLADWFHFMWDRLRGIRKDITQQALCCADSIKLVEMCARFHAHCAARLADLEHTQFDQKLNTDNLTKCLQTLKHMYADVDTAQKPHEAEFRGYIALLNLGDANFWWEIKQLPREIQKSKAIMFAIRIFNAIDNNNYVRFFRLVRDDATYLQACILLRYFNDVRARALARIVKAYAPRGGSRYPAEELMNALVFESIENMKSFINHYGLRFGKTDDSELTVILDRNQFIEDSLPYPLHRAVNLIESKRQCTVGEVIAGGPLPKYEIGSNIIYSSFNKDGTLKEVALIAEDQGYNTINDSNKDINALKAEIQRLSQGVRSFGNAEKSAESKASLFLQYETKRIIPEKSLNSFISATSETRGNTMFLFKPAIPVAPTEVIKNSADNIFGVNTKNMFSFSKPQESLGTDLLAETIFQGKKILNSKPIPNNSSLFGNTSNDNKSIFQSSQKLFKATTDSPTNKTVIFTKPENIVKFETGGNLFAQSSAIKKGDTKPHSNIFSTFKNANESNNKSSVFASNGETLSNQISPSSLFKSACNSSNVSDGKSYSIFQTKNKIPSVADNIFNSLKVPNNDTVYEFDQKVETQDQLQHISEVRIKEEVERKKQEELKEEARRKELKRQEEDRLKEELRKKQEELKLLEEKQKREEEKKQEELRKKLEEEKKLELKRIAEEEERKFKIKIDKESSEIIEELVSEVNDETVIDLLKEERELLKKLMSHANVTTEEILTELCNEICRSEMKAEKFWMEKLMKKWFYIWRKQFVKNLKRRRLLEDTPTWLTENTPIKEASSLKRLVENAALKNMNAVHRGYKFTGEMRHLPSPEPYNIMEIIKSPLLKRMKQINYPYDKCFFWKVTLVSPGSRKWLYRKIDIEKWLKDAFGDKKRHDTSDSLIHVGKQSWNHLMDFVISVSLTNREKGCMCSEAVDGTNGLLLYTIENEYNLIDTLEETLKHKYPYQVIPVAVIMPKIDGNFIQENTLDSLLTSFINRNIISAYKIFVVNPQNLFESLNMSTKSALKWLAKKCPQNPPVEIDYLKSICQRYLGNEVWYRFKSEGDNRIKTILNDLHKLVKCYNIAVDKLTNVITNEDLFNYPSFPLEFKEYLNHMSPYPKPFEFIPSNVKSSENILAIKDIMKQLKLPSPVSAFRPLSIASMQEQIRKYCNQIGWFDNPEQVVCKVVSVLPNQLTDLNMTNQQFTKCFENYDLLDFLNVLVYEKINSLNDFHNRYAIYERLVLEEYRNSHWLYDIEDLSKMKHKALEYEDDLDLFIEAKRRKMTIDSMEHIMLEDKDCTLVAENIKVTNDNISKYSSCNEAVKQLEEQIEEERKKSIHLENLLRTALSDI